MSTSDLNHLNQSDFVRPSDERVGWFLRLIQNMMSRKLNQNMEQVYVHNLDAIKDLALDKGVIIAPNHACYWDSCLYFVLSRLLSDRAFVFVAKETLQRLPFLRWCGAVPINTHSKRKAIQQLIHAKPLYIAPTQFWIFPQGEHRPPHHQPLQFQKGVTILGQHLQLPIVPVSIDYLYKDSEQPIAYVSFRQPLPYTSTVEDIEREITTGLTKISSHHLGLEELEFAPVYPQSSNTNDDLATRMLAWFAEKVLGTI